MRAWLSSLLPAPSTIVVFSRTIRTRRARPSMSRRTLSSAMPSSSEMTWPPVTTAISSSIALRRSPKTGCLDRRDPEPAAQAIDHQSGEHLALHVLGNDDERATRLHDLFEKRQQGLQARQLP